jgi:acyl carrier protein
MSNVTDKSSLTTALRTALIELILLGEQPIITTVEQIDDDNDFREYGFTSVDFLEFVVSLEQKLDTEIPDEAFTEASLLTVNDWVRFLSK